jgi:TMEM175 potassium channel family protein
MTKARLEAFSDGVIAILITIMVLELKVPHGTEWDALRPILPVLGTYLMSFVFLGIYWANHHHLLHTLDRVNGAILWANLHLLFWLSLIPFTMSWMSENNFAPAPTAAYGVVQLLSAVAYTILERTIIAHQGPQSKLAAAIGKEVKGYVSMALYLAGIGVAFIQPWIAFLLYATVTLMWLVPDRRIERRI